MVGVKRNLTTALGAWGLWLALCSPATAAVPKATLLPSGRAVPPPSAPRAIKAMIRAANQIRHKPYRWGGGHVNWISAGYDCSGSMSYVMHGAELLESPLDSTGFMHWGKPGPSPWIQIYANHEHVFAVIDGLRWDTVPPTDNPRGPGWSTEMLPTRGFVVRHPSQLRAGSPVYAPQPQLPGSSAETPPPTAPTNPAPSGGIAEGPVAGSPASNGGVSPTRP